MNELPGADLSADVAVAAPPPQDAPPAFAAKLMKIQRPRLDRPQASFSAASIAARYGYPTVASSKEWVAVISLGGGIAAADVATYCKQYGFQVPPIRIVSVDGGANAYTGDPSSADGENALDVQNVIGATGGKVGILLYCCPNSGKGFSDGVMQVARDNLACACSISWGSPESGADAAMEAAVAACNAAGIPVFAASGDAGSGDGQPGTNVDSPASLPGVIGCGGTTITAAGDRAWTYGGGGPSHIYPKPAWQSVAPGTMRGVPDVSANADPNTGYPITLKGQWTSFGGTSAVGPMWAAAVALIVTITGKRLFNLAQTIYSTNLLTDVTAGSNGAWQAGTGYDYCAGEGVPNKVFFDHMTGGVIVVPPAPVPPAPPVPPVPPAPPTLPVDLVTALEAILQWLLVLLAQQKK